MCWFGLSCLDGVSVYRWRRKRVSIILAHTARSKLIRYRRRITCSIGKIDQIGKADLISQYGRCPKSQSGTVCAKSRGIDTGVMSSKVYY